MESSEGDVVGLLGMRMSPDDIVGHMGGFSMNESVFYFGVHLPAFSTSVLDL